MDADLQQQFIGDMLAESYEGLDQFDEEILVLEKGEASDEVLNSIFRVVHTLKGTVGCLGFNQTQDTAHAGENLLDLMREGKIEIDSDIASLLLSLSDALRARLQSIEASGGEGEIDDSALVGRLEAAAKGKPFAESAPAEAAVEAVEDSSDDGFGLFADEPEPSAVNGTNGVLGSRAPFGGDAWGLFEDPFPEPEPSLEPEPEPSPEAVAEGSPPPPIAEEATPKAEKKSPTAAPPLAKSASVRVDVSLLDQLMNLAGELVLTRNQLVQVSTRPEPRKGEVKDIAQRLNLITTDLQEGIMKTRMQPIQMVWSKYPRIVRDIAQKLGKQVRLETFGSETELDRTIIEAIRDPLTHLVRNALDHGLEKPADRLAAGKPEEGALYMRAFHEGGQVNIEIVDDGAGIRIDKVKARALQRGLVSADKLASMTDREVANLIFAPGFSTAETISDVSGRGVGMDVVRTNIEKIGGSVDLLSRVGAGTTVKVKIPLTLAIIPAMVAEAAGQRFAIPQVNLLELVRLDPNLPNQGIEAVYGVPVYRLRGRLLPLVYLREELKLGGDARDAGNIVVLRADEQEFGLVVDRVCDTEEIVVKPLSRQLMQLPVFSGATIMGDGKVALILDLLGLAERARVLAENTQSAEAKRTEDAAAEVHARGSRMLLFSLPGREHLALDLDQATRLEQFPLDRFEQSGSREAIQYRGGIMPIVRMNRLLPGTDQRASLETDGEIPVIVCEHQKRYIGLAVGDILDIIETEIELQPGTAEPGSLGSAIIEGQITDIVDLPSLLRRSLPASA